MKAKSCFACGIGTLRPTNLRGRTFTYRDEVDLVFDEDLIVPACDSCGDLALTSSLTRQFSVALERARLDRKRTAAQHFVTVAERDYPQIPRSAWEDTLGLSRGYLSRLISGTRLPDAPLEILLEGFARDPQAVLRLVRAVGRRMPAELATT